jgi:hypothetical protein
MTHIYYEFPEKNRLWFESYWSSNFHSLRFFGQINTSFVFILLSVRNKNTNEDRQLKFIL